MGILFIGGLLLLNVAIAWWNCYVTGRSWDVVKHHGTAFERILLWCGAIQAGIGFSMPILLGLAFVVTTSLTSGEQPMLTQEEAQLFMEGIFSLWYLLIILPLLSTGFIIWVHSVREAIKHRDFASIAVAGWNTYANVSNFANASSGIGDALGGVGQVFSGLKGRDNKGVLIALLIMIVIVALLAGALITATLIQRYRRAAAIDMAATA